jgi:microcystin-dependent protein
MRTYFTLPDLRGKALVGAGGPLGLPLGKTTGEYSVILDSRDLPKHSHSFSGAWSADKDSYLTSPERNQTSFLGNFGFDGGTAPGYVGEMENDVVLDSSSIAQNGSNLPHNNMAPFLTINYYICSEGYYPPKP